MAAAARRIGRLKRVDRAAVGFITVGGIAVIVAVVGILVFIAAEAVPLLYPATLKLAGHVPIVGARAPGTALRILTVGVDEYRAYCYTINDQGLVNIRRYATGEPVSDIPVPGTDGASVTAASRSLLGNYLAAGLSDGRVALMQARVTPEYDGERMKGMAIELRERGVADADPEKRLVREVSYLEQDGQKFVAALVSDRDIAYWWTDADGNAKHASLDVPVPHRITSIRLGRSGNLVAGTDRGSVFHWDASGPAPVLTDVSPVGGGAITALEWVLGGKSWIAGTEDGSISGWFRAPAGTDGRLAMVRAHEYSRQPAPVVAIAMSGRERSFATLGRDGSIILRHFTSERVLADMRLTSPADALLITPKADAIEVLTGITLHHFTLINPHPETSLKTLFQKVWYEGYAKPEFVWQSTGATDDFESKLSLVPLIFGTIKGTLYAMLFAIPLSVLAALYTSQFVHASIRAKVKPAIEIMAALPSVVIGFLAGLYLATAISKHLVGVLLLLPLMPIFGVSGLFVWRQLPRRIATRLRPGTEAIVVMVPMVLLAGWTAFAVEPGLELWLFQGDARFWLTTALGVTYDQRNCLVVGLAMGFAIIPIIFTIAEDACSSVPSSLTAASLAVGASRWQTAVRVVLPTASPGIFSAIMIGFGRAVGETMIVLMATGNTPITDWSIFNGIRTLAANIAVEIPESPYGGTLYRTLFLTAALLFVLTFLVNTAAELIRQRLRERYRAI